jgi:hypothetical protein
LRDGSEWLPHELSIDHNTRVVARECPSFVNNPVVHPLASRRAVFARRGRGTCRVDLAKIESLLPLR